MHATRPALCFDTLYFPKRAEASATADGTVEVLEFRKIGKF
jgi:hypothetical protein